MRQYIVDLVTASRHLEKVRPEWKNYLVAGGSPRATKALLHCAAGNALLAGRDFVTPDDVGEIIADVLRHRLVLSYEAQADGVSRDDIIQTLIEQTQAP